MSDILAEICNYKKEIIARDKKEISFEAIKELAKNKAVPPSFAGKIVEKLAVNKSAIIAEIKQKSPSQGLISTNFNVAEIAKNYANSGACCISVLTDEKYFAGQNDYVEIAKLNSGLPILRKDFVIDEYQIYQAKLLGASAILLIMSCLKTEQALKFEEIANSIGLDVLAESHNETELKEALKLKTKLIGVNNRNLKTLDISLENIKNLKGLVPDDKILICESGINSLDDYKNLKNLGLNSFLIGGFLMKDPKNLELLSTHS